MHLYSCSIIVTSIVDIIILMILNNIQYHYVKIHIIPIHANLIVLTQHTIIQFPPNFCHFLCPFLRLPLSSHPIRPRHRIIFHKSHCNTTKYPTLPFPLQCHCIFPHIRIRTVIFLFADMSTSFIQHTITEQNRTEQRTKQNKTKQSKTTK